MDPEAHKSLRAAGRLGSVGIEFGLYVVLLLLAGWWLDGKFGTKPWFSLAGIILGSFGGFRSIFRALKLQEFEEERDRKGQ